MMRPRHPIAHRLDVHPAVRQRSLVALREGHDACGLDQLSQRATEFTHRLRLGQHQRSPSRSLPQVRLELIETVDQDLGVPLGDPCVL